MIPNSFYARIFARLFFSFFFFLILCIWGVVFIGVKRLQHFGRVMSVFIRLVDF